MDITHAKVSTISDGGDAQKVQPSDWNAVHIGNGLDIYNVKDYGAQGDGATDDTTVLQAGLDALVAGTTAILYIPAGTYKITAALTLALCNNKTIVGAGRDATIIRQFTANIPVLKPTAENTWGINLWDLTLEYNTQQISGQTGAVALGFSVAVGTGSGWYYWHMRNITFRKANVGYGVVGTGQLPLFNNRHEGLWFQDMAVTTLRMVSPTVIGQMPNTFENTIINNGGIVPTSKAIIGNGAELVFNGLTVTDWRDQIIYANGGSFIYITDLHVETCDIVTQYARLFEIADLGFLQVDGAMISVTVNNANNDHYVFNIGAGAKLSFRDIYMAITNSAGTMAFLLCSGTGAAVIGHNVIDANSTVIFPVTTGDTGSASNIVQIDNVFYGGVLKLGYGTTQVDVRTGSGSPESAVTANPGSLFLRTDGSTSTTLYVKTSGSGNTGWTAK